MFEIRFLILAGAIAVLPVLEAEKLPKPDRIATAPTAAQALLIREGITLHDHHNYEGAIAKYKQVLAENPWEVNALQELALTYFESKNYQEALATARLGAQCKSESLSHFYIMIGNALDELGKGKEAVEIYKAAIKQNPGLGLLHYNFAISLRRAGKEAEAKAAVEKALQYEPAHASSHATLGAIYRDMGYRTPAILAYSRFLVLEPESQRSIQVLPVLQELLMGGATKGKEPNQISIFVPSTPKSLMDEGDFGPVEMMIAIQAAADLMVKSEEAKGKPTTAYERLGVPL